MNENAMNEEETRTYRIFQCPSCTRFTWDTRGTQRGWCSIERKKKAVMENPEYDLRNSAPNCGDWNKGKANNK